MPKFTVKFEDVAFTSKGPEHDPIELRLSEHELRGFSEVRAAEKEFPAGVLAVTKAYASPDSSVYKNGRTDGEVKLFVSIDLLVHADDQDEAEAMSPPVHLLATLTDMLDDGLYLEGSWEVLESEQLDEYLVRNIDDASLFLGINGEWSGMDEAITFVHDDRVEANLPAGGEWIDKALYEAPAIKL